MIKVAIIHPSFGRPQQAFTNCIEWINAVDRPGEIEYLIGLDDNDPKVEEYYKVFFLSETSPLRKLGRFEINVGDSRCAVAAINSEATILSSTSELIVIVSDDMTTILHWDNELFKMLQGIDNFAVPKFISVSDGVREYGITAVYLIVTRAWYTRLGYLLYPEYDGGFADNDMYGVAERLNAVIHAPHLVFQHRHYSCGLNTFDATYRRINNQVSLARNLEIYKKRVARNFDL